MAAEHCPAQPGVHGARGAAAVVVGGGGGGNGGQGRTAAESDGAGGVDAGAGGGKGEWWGGGGGGAAARVFWRGVCEAAFGDFDEGRVKGVEIRFPLPPPRFLIPFLCLSSDLTLYIMSNLVGVGKGGGFLAPIFWEKFFITRKHVVLGVWE